MIAYVLVMIVSLSTGQTIQAVLEGPMARNWCEQLIQQDRYKGQDGSSRKLATCMTGIEAQQALASNACKRSPGPSPRWPTIQYDCAPAPAPVPVSIVNEDPPAPVPPAQPSGAPVAPPPGGGSASPQHEQEAVPPSGSVPGPVAEPPAPQAAPPAPPPPAAEAPPAPQRQIHLGAAASALLGQAEKQAASGQHAEAAATLERALRIEPENPLLWIELGRLRMSAGKTEQAEGLYRKALTLAAGDGVVQARAWGLIAESLRARGRNEEAAQAEAHISVASPD